jgi:hypothetical protein
VARSAALAHHVAWVRKALPCSGPGVALRP